MKRVAELCVGGASVTGGRLLGNTTGQQEATFCLEIYPAWLYIACPDPYTLMSWSLAGSIYMLCPVTFPRVKNYLILAHPQEGVFSMRRCSAVLSLLITTFWSIELCKEAMKNDQRLQPLPLPSILITWFITSCRYTLSLWSVPLRLRQLDIEFMKRLSHSVNIIPIIAKADTMTIEERQEFKQRVSVLKLPCTVALPACLLSALQSLGYKQLQNVIPLLLKLSLWRSSDLPSVSLWFVL